MGIMSKLVYLPISYTYRRQRPAGRLQNEPAFRRLLINVLVYNDQPIHFADGFDGEREGDALCWIIVRVAPTMTAFGQVSKSFCGVRTVTATLTGYQSLLCPDRQAFY